MCLPFSINILYTVDHCTWNADKYFLFVSFPCLLHCVLVSYFQRTMTGRSFHVPRMVCFYKIQSHNFAPSWVWKTRFICLTLLRHPREWISVHFANKSLLLERGTEFLLRLEHPSLILSFFSGIAKFDHIIRFQRQPSPDHCCNIHDISCLFSHSLVLSYCLHQLPLSSLIRLLALLHTHILVCCFIH